ncbi:MAG: hypothetical protein H0W67_06925 [Gemmatimonadales bacterium]|nr:hypothetical protein [Gemmatimonadales bacterium]
MFELLIAVTAGLAGFTFTRGFVRRRLRFVDAVQSRLAPLLAGLLAAALVWPLAALPLVTVAAAVAFGVGTGMGTLHGARDIRRASGSLRRSGV